MAHDKKVDVLAIGPHPDDIEMGCGGTVIKLGKMGYSVGILTLTRGELGTRGTKELRAQEARRAAEILGVTFFDFLDLRDGHVMNTGRNRDVVVGVIRKYKPYLVMASHWYDDHPDHTQCSYLVKDSVYLAGLQNYLPGSGSHRTKGLIYFMGRGEFQPTFVVDISNEFKQKMEAIRAYASQFYQAGSNEPETALSSPNFLKLFEARGRFYGRMIECEYGEPFYSKYPPQILDPVTIWGHAQ